MKKYTDDILILRKVLEKGNIIIPTIPSKDILMNTLMYDGVFSTFLTKNYLEERKIYIDQLNNINGFLQQKNNIGNMILNIKQTIEKDILYEMARKKGITDYYIIKEAVGQINKLFPRSHPIKIESNINEGFEEGLKLLSKAFYKILQKQSIKYSWTYGTFFVNWVLSAINLPQIVFHTDDRARIFRALDNYVSFEKEFFLTIIEFLNAAIAEKLFIGESMRLEDIKKMRGSTAVYTRPGFSWRDSEGMKCTWYDYKKFDQYLITFFE